MRGFDLPEPVVSLLDEISAIEGLSLKGKTRTAVYRKSKPFLHFHWNDVEVVADVRYAAEWERVPVNTLAERRKLLDDVRSFVAAK